MKYIIALGLMLMPTLAMAAYLTPEQCVEKGGCVYGLPRSTVDSCDAGFIRSPMNRRVVTQDRDGTPWVAMCASPGEITQRGKNDDHKREQ